MKNITKTTRISVSVGIPAYNEEAGIGRVVNSVLTQKQDGWILKELIIISDGSSDGTADIVSSIKDKRVKFFNEKTRKGKTHRLQEMFDQFDSDILVLLDADIVLSDKFVLSNLIKGFEDPNVMLVGGNSSPLPPCSFIESAIYSSFEVFYKSRLNVRGGNNIFGATGSIMALKREFAKKIKMPKIFNEDSYIYLFCLKSGYKFRYVDDAKIFYKLPRNSNDYIRQLFRSEPAAVGVEVNKYFGDLATQELSRPALKYLYYVIVSLIKNPIGVVYITLINIICRPLIPLISKNYKLSWFTAKSTHI